MQDYWVVFISIAIITSASCCEIVNLTFPESIKIGVSTASYQIEGAWNVSDKGENVWDYWTHNYPSLIKDRSNGDIAWNSYHKFEEDVRWIRELGFDFYRFSISWSRVLPTGFRNVISQDGIKYYKNLISELLAKDIQPVVTLYHWDHPQVIEHMGGWTNELMDRLVCRLRKNYFSRIGKIFSTINEPKVFCQQGYNGTSKAPGKELYNLGIYLCGHNVLKAHAKVYHMYDEEFRPTQQGQIGMVLSGSSYFPVDPIDDISPDTAFQFECGWFMNPIFIGDYPEIMKTRIAEISKVQGFASSRLPEFSPEWISYINGTADYFGLNHYTSNIVTPDPADEIGIYNSDEGLIHSSDPSWPVSASNWLWVVPIGFGNVLRKIKNDYGNPPVFVLENGYSDVGGLDDYNRIEYYYSYLKEMLIAAKRDGCNIQRYTIWSIMDNFEWSVALRETEQLNFPQVGGKKYFEFASFRKSQHTTVTGIFYPGHELVANTLASAVIRKYDLELFFKLSFTKERKPDLYCNRTFKLNYGL